MAKIILGKLPPDDPIFKSGPQVFVPASKPSTDNSQSDTSVTNQDKPASKHSNPTDQAG